MRYPIVIFVLFVMTGCASTYDSSGFLSSYDGFQKGEFFEQAFVSRSADFSDYSAVAIEPVESRFLNDADEHEASDIRHLTGDFERKLKESFAKAGYRVLSSGDGSSQTLVVKTALTHVEAPERVLNAVTSALIWTPVTVGAAAFEAEGIDAQSGDTVFRVSEKHSGGGVDAKSLAVGSFTKYTHAESAFSIWSKHLAEMIQGE